MRDPKIKKLTFSTCLNKKYLALKDSCKLIKTLMLYLSPS